MSTLLLAAAMTAFIIALFQYLELSIRYFKQRYAEYKFNKRIMRSKKYLAIRNKVIDYYKDLYRIYDVLQVPVFMIADDVMKEVIKTDKDIDYFYKKLPKAI